MSSLAEKNDFKGRFVLRKFEIEKKVEKTFEPSSSEIPRLLYDLRF